MLAGRARAGIRSEDNQRVVRGVQQILEQRPRGGEFAGVEMLVSGAELLLNAAVAKKRLVQPGRFECRGWFG